MILAACCGDVKFYRWSDMGLLGVYEAQDGGSVCSISWRCEGKSLLATSDSGEPTLLGAPEGPEAVAVEPYDSIDVGGFAVHGTCSNATADLASFGLEDGEVLAYDLGTKTRLFSVDTRLEGGAHHLQFSPDDSNLAVGARGEIFMLDSKWRPCASLAMASGSTLTSLAYGTVLCGASDRGVVSTWDPETIDDLVTIRAHEGSVTGLAFVGDALASVGEDGRFRGYDLRSMTVVHDARTDVGLASVAHAVGTCEVAVGGADGRLFAYDLRRMAAPLRSVAVGRGPVKRIAFPNVDDDFAFFSSEVTSRGVTTARRRYSDEAVSASGDFNNNGTGSTLKGGSKGFATLRDGTKGEASTTPASSLPSPPPPPSLRIPPSTTATSGRSEELDELVSLLQGTLRSVEEVFDEKLEHVFHGMTVSASRTFIDVEAKLGKCWGHVIDFLGAAGEELAKKAKMAKTASDGRGSYTDTTAS